MNDDQLRQLESEGHSWAEISRRVGQPYGRVYSRLIRLGLVQKRGQEVRAKWEAAEREKEKEHARYVDLLERYANGELVPSEMKSPDDILVTLYNTMNIGDRIPDLEDLDTLIAIRKSPTWVGDK